MAKLLQWFARGALAALFVVVVCVPAVAAIYDAPTASVVDVGLFQVTLQVKAGASGAPAGFVVEWMTRSNYDAHGSWPAIGDPARTYCIFDGTPTLNMWGATSFALSANGLAAVQPGDLFDETGVVTNFVDQLQPGTEYVFRAYAAGEGGAVASDYSGTVMARTVGTAECTQGFWKNHPETWPPTALPMLLGTVSYTKAELLAILDEPAVGNGLISLAHQLIAAKLNISNGSNPAPIAATIAAADALIGGLVCPPVGGGFIDPSVSSPLTEMLDAYNNGKLGGVVDCPTGVNAITTWGRVKALYR